MTNQVKDGAGGDQMVSIGAEETFRFVCHPEISCFNACCADLSLILSPYDLLRLRGALNLSSRVFIERFGEVGLLEDSGWPFVALAMKNDARRSCPFVGVGGCTVYEDRPAACRAYPLGRGAGFNAAGQMDEQFVLVREAHCKGFDQGQAWTPGSWMRDQMLDLHNRMNDRYLGLVSKWQRSGATLGKPQFAMVYQTLYGLDEFQKRISRPGWLTHSGVPEDRQQRILNDDTERLLYAIEWLDEILFRS